MIKNCFKKKDLKPKQLENKDESSVTPKEMIRNRLQNINRNKRESSTFEKENEGRNENCKFLWYYICVITVILFIILS